MENVQDVPDAGRILIDNTGCTPEQDHSVVANSTPLDITSCVIRNAEDDSSFPVETGHVTGLVAKINDDILKQKSTVRFDRVPPNTTSTASDKKKNTVDKLPDHILSELTEVCAADVFLPSLKLHISPFLSQPPVKSHLFTHLSLFLFSISVYIYIYPCQPVYL